MRKLSKRKTERFISIDMDETMICSLPFSSCQNFTVAPVAELSVFKNGENFKTAVFKRPGIDEFLKSILKFGSLNVFTLGVEDYAERVLQRTGLMKYFDRVFTRESCQEHAWDLSESELLAWGCSRSQACMMKDLRLVSQDLDLVVAIDDNLSVYPIPQKGRVISVAGFTPANPSFFSGESDLVGLKAIVAEKFSS